MIRDVYQIRDDIIEKKSIVGELFYTDPDIIEMLDNSKLDPTCPDEAMYKCIYPFIRIPGVQDESKSYICYTLDDNGVSHTNRAMKTQAMKVVVFVHQDIVETKMGINRHDILGYLIKDVLNQSNALGMQLNCVFDREGTTDTNYVTRTLHFEMTSPGNLQPFNTNKYERRSIVDRQDRVLQRETVGGDV